MFSQWKKSNVGKSHFKHRIYHVLNQILCIMHTAILRLTTSIRYWYKSYFDLYLNTAYAAHYIYFNTCITYKFIMYHFQPPLHSTHEFND